LARDQDRGAANTDGLALSELSHRLTSALQHFSLDRFSSLSPDWGPSFEEGPAEADSPNADGIQEDGVELTLDTNSPEPSQRRWEPERETVTVSETVTTVHKTETVTVREPQPIRSGGVREQLLELRRLKEEGLLSKNDFVAQRAVVLAQRASGSSTDQPRSERAEVQPRESMQHAAPHERRSHQEALLSTLPESDSVVPRGSQRAERGASVVL
jgi:hypothetical protein